MKRLLLLTFTVLMLFTTQSKAQGGDYKPYINFGANLSSGVTSLGGELGYYNNKAWVSVGLSTASSEKGSWYLSPKYYRKLTNAKEDNRVDCYAWGAVNVALDQSHSLSVEPGLALVYNITSKFAPQLSLSSPIGENTVFHQRAWPLNLGISLNYWIR